MYPWVVNYAVLSHFHYIRRVFVPRPGWRLPGISQVGLQEPYTVAHSECMLCCRLGRLKEHPLPNQSNILNLKTGRPVKGGSFMWLDFFLPVYVEKRYSDTERNCSRAVDVTVQTPRSEDRRKILKCRRTADA